MENSETLSTASVVDVTASQIDGWWVLTFEGLVRDDAEGKTVKVRTLDNVTDVVRDSWNAFNASVVLDRDFEVNLKIHNMNSTHTTLPTVSAGGLKDLSKTPGRGVFYPSTTSLNGDGEDTVNNQISISENGLVNPSRIVGGEDLPKFQVDCEDLTVAYNNGEVVAVDKLNLKVSGGIVVGILGGNGAGKTSTLRTFGGVIPPTSGVLRIGGHLMSSKRGAELARRDLGYCPDTGGLIRQATIREHIGVALALRDMEDGWPDALNLVEKFGLTRFMDRQTGSFSHGMSRRLSVLLAVLTSKTVLILDEPFDGVDPLGVEATEDSIRVAAESGLGVIVSTHMLSLLAKVSDNICVMSEGKIIAEEDASVFMSSDGEKYYETLLRNSHKKINM